MKTSALLTALGCALACLFLPPTPSPRASAVNDTTAQAAIHAVLEDQQAAWNRGDVGAFMKGYWNSPALTFAGANGVTRGWEPVMERYRKTYPDAVAMGHLDFSDIEIRLLGNDAALVLGRWHLQRANDAPTGVFTLVFQRFPEGWRIIHDHTSADAKP
ncbi:MAG TPA: nuclear transport factor 2 family protein [Candidatus Saccharimonadales bacterium]|nr:nuclear transport factor 2 family protein [Candidatus Saccharimonadales bacterium]